VHLWPHIGLAIGLLVVAQNVRELTPGTSIPRELSPGQVHTYQLTLARGDFVRLTIKQQGIDVAAALLDPDGREVVAVDAMDDEFRPELVAAIADVSGTYTVTMRPATNRAAQGGYVVHLDPPRPASASDELLVAAERAFARGRKRRNVNDATTWPEALVDFNAARDRYRTLGDRSGEMKALIEIGVTENYLSRPEALSAAEEAERIAREIDDRPAIARALRVLASVHALAGNLAAAASSVEQATDINRAIGNPAAEARSLSYTAVLYRRLGDVEKALELYERAIPLALATKDRALEATLLNNLGVAYVSLGEYERALVVYEKSLANARAASDSRRQSDALGNLGGLQRRFGNYAKARDLQLQALALDRKSSDAQSEAIHLNGLGLIYSQAGDYDKALDYHRAALGITRQLGDVSGQASSLNLAGRAMHRLARADEAVAALQEALSIHRRTRERPGERDVLSNLASVERDRGNLDEALRYLQRSVDLDEAMRAEITSPELRTTFAAAEQNKYELLIDVLQRKHRIDMSGGYDAVALEVSERARARALLDSLLDARVDLREGIEPALLERERSLQRHLNDASAAVSKLFGSRGRDEALATAAAQVDRLTAEYQQVQSQIRRESPRYAAATQPQPWSAREIQRSVLDEATVLLEFALGEERSWLWAVTPHRVTSVELPSRQKIEAAARALYERFTARQRRRSEGTVAYAARVAASDAGLRRAAAEMSRMLLGGIAEPLNGEWRGKRLAIVPAGALEYLPFAALPVPDRAPAIPLIARHELVTIPSASVLGMLRRETSHRAPATGLLAIVADPVFDSTDPRIVSRHGRRGSLSASRGVSLEGLAIADEGFSRLPFSRDEATAIASLADSRQVFRALDFTANRATVLGGGLRRYRFVHFATHGVVDSRRPALSGLILSLFDERGAPQNGYVRLHDIYNTRFDADLVVLSACQTALGKEVKGEGLVGLTRAFMYAGVPRVVASLWRVSDHATAELMKRFYREMLQRRLEPAAALRAAQRDLSRDPRWREPYYWAGFVLQGDWRP
jgi:CHAT domain-containing protein/tetratricopeptide (TPR) repeat protein